ncbi:hypothetical protein BFW87_04015 [Pseudomonas fluorescens]|uniref:Uncharacterized protein n=1 Tax=Pseudomonas fluorescens TaxID=294 RepID=A0A1T2Z5R9_PSEFL|nr:hypothetical protein [Pseudomonas fluorescens]OPA99397.1 hypothetical protein BFW87_04015 [Pseudomonas fluorescens]
MITVPALRFLQQDSAVPTPNLDTSLVPGEFTELVSSVALQKEDFVVATMSSTVPGVIGGQFNQSFEVNADSASLQVFIPKKFVKANSGKAVLLQLRITRQKVISVAPSVIVNIDQGVIVVPPPGITWDFNDGTRQGWVPQGSYIGGVLKVISQRVVVDLTNSKAGSSHIMSIAVPVVAGRTYRCGYLAGTDLLTADGSRLRMTMNGNPIGRTSPVAPDFLLLGSGTFTAPITGTVHLGIFNEAVPNGVHSLYLDNISMTEEP